MADIKKTIIITVTILVAFGVANRFLSSCYSPAVSSKPLGSNNPIPLKKHLPEEVVRKNYIVPGMDFEESVFYIGQEEIARQKIVHGKILESRGEIPDGKVKFFDAYHKTYGDERYLRGKKHGPADTYYDDGRLKSSSEYFFGKLILNKEFYNDGALRMEENYDDAIIFPGEPDRETGIGKVYFRDGTLKYEWNFTHSDQVHYKKSYNRNGELTLDLYYDKDGDLLKR